MSSFKSIVFEIYRPSKIQSLIGIGIHRKYKQLTMEYIQMLGFHLIYALHQESSSFEMCRPSKILLSYYSIISLVIVGIHKKKKKKHLPGNILKFKVMSDFCIPSRIVSLERSVYEDNKYIYIVITRHIPVFARFVLNPPSFLRNDILNKKKIKKSVSVNSRIV